MKYFGKYLDMFVSNKTKKIKNSKTEKTRTKKKKRIKEPSDGWSGIV